MYPIQSIAIIAPVLFIVLMIVFPIIGFFGGWKRAAYWGGGNLLFYLIGLITWKLAGTAISSALAPMIKELLSKAFDVSQLDLTQMTAALVPPIFFLIIALVGNILLVINYYAWFKRVSGIAQDIKIKKAAKFNKWAAKVEGKPASEAQKVEIQTAKGAVIAQKTTKQKVISGAVGAVALTALMLPGVITTTNAVFYATTTSATRTGWVADMYNAFDSLDKKMSWASYYSGETGDAFNSLLSGLQLSQQTTGDEPITVIDPNTNEPMVDSEGKEVVIPANTKVIDIVTSTVPTNVQLVVNDLKELQIDDLEGIYTEAYDKKYQETYDEERAKGTPKEEAVKKAEEAGDEAGIAAGNSKFGNIAKPVNHLAQVWNTLVGTDQTQAQLQAVFNSNAVTDLINQFLNPTKSSTNWELTPVDLKDEYMDNIFGKWDDNEGKRVNGLYQRIFAQYESGEKTGTSTIEFTFTNPDTGETYEFSFKMIYLKALKIKASALQSIIDLAGSYIKYDKLQAHKEADEALFKKAIKDVVNLILYSEE